MPAKYCDECGMELGDIKSDFCWRCFIKGRWDPDQIHIVYSQSYNQIYVNFAFMRSQSMWTIDDNTSEGLVVSLSTEPSHMLDFIGVVAHQIPGGRPLHPLFTEHQIDAVFMKLKNPPPYLEQTEVKNEEVKVEEKEPEYLYHLRFWEKHEGNVYWFDSELEIDLAGGKEIPIKDVRVGDHLSIEIVDTGKFVPMKVVKILKEEKDATKFIPDSKRRGFYLKAQ